jgi:hypothetical protein
VKKFFIFRPDKRESLKCISINLATIQPREMKLRTVWFFEESTQQEWMNNEKSSDCALKLYKPSLQLKTEIMMTLQYA